MAAVQNTDCLMDLLCRQKMSQSHPWAESSKRILFRHHRHHTRICDGDYSLYRCSMSSTTEESTAPESPANNVNGDLSEQIQALQRRIEILESENTHLRSLIPDGDGKDTKEYGGEDKCGTCPGDAGGYSAGILTSDQIERYSRQLLIHGGFGVEGQTKLLSSSVLVVGAGGIGSTVILYLAACGVGRLSIVDFDEVDTSNLHRQVIHKSQNVGMNKAESACKAVKDLNPTIRCEAVRMPLTTSNALELVSSHDCVIDASDNPLTRYLINDACVLGGKPLISGSAMGIEGQLTVYNYKGGPCYRCLYPKPNVSEGCKSCADNGVLGPVPGLIGVLQAVEAMKVITGVGDVMYDRLAMYDSLQCSFLRIKKPPKQPKCQVCGSNATIKSMADSEEASKTARGPSCPIDGKRKPLFMPPKISELLEISCSEYHRVLLTHEPHVLLDVRVPEQFDLCSLEGAINVPLADLESQLDKIEGLSKGKKPIYCVCRRGIASVAATNILSEAKKRRQNIHSVKNLKGGLDRWREEIDRSFPKY